MTMSHWGLGQDNLLLQMTDLNISIPVAKKIQILRINMQSPLNLNVSDFNSTILQQVSVK